MASRHEVRAFLPNIPNILTCSRMLIAVVFPVAEPRYRLALVVVALLSEFFDGFLARRFGWESALGRLLDPLADKVFYFSVGLTFVLNGRITLLAVLLIGLRDFVVGLGSFGVVVYGRSRDILEFKPSLTGKLTTTAQYAVMLCLLVFSKVPAGLLAATAVLSFLATVSYLRYYRREVLSPGKPATTKVSST